ncbi:hypothetical protein TELCIR_07109 [Teladorsagia circumcincta]|uniref:Pecanex-like protein n=1 Tax=Teladorsagia circumcincta TaxID=45464 RepID=A0A2G9ULA6_TELCI|nr:hypothetical protein TELCIR_07109 [Teladorsagia circumcincta]
MAYVAPWQISWGSAFHAFAQKYRVMFQKSSKKLGWRSTDGSMGDKCPAGSKRYLTTRPKEQVAVAVLQDICRVVTGKYIIDGYSITDNSAVNLLQVHELRRLLVTLYVKCIVYYALTSNKLQNWLANETVRSTLEPIVANPRYADVDHLFCSTNDEDFDMNEMVGEMQAGPESAV